MFPSYLFNFKVISIFNNVLDFGGLHLSAKLKKNPTSPSSPSAPLPPPPLYLLKFGCFAVLQPYQDPFLLFFFLKSTSVLNFSISLCNTSL